VDRNTSIYIDILDSYTYQQLFTNYPSLYTVLSIIFI